MTKLLLASETEVALQDMELSAATAPVGDTQGHHATGYGVLWRILAAGLLALSVGAENIDVTTFVVPGTFPKNVGSCGTSMSVVRRWPTLSLNMSFYSKQA